MKRFELLPSFHVGHKQIDAEHEHLIDLLNACIDIADHHGDRAAFRDTFAELTDALRAHIRHEEAIMKAFDFIDADAPMHDEGIRLFDALLQDCDGNVDLDIILKQASHGLLEMILKSDLAFKSHLQQIGYHDA